MTILVTGARGGIGGRVADLLARAGHPVRPSSRGGAGPLAGTGTAVFDISDPATPTTALDGVRTVFLYPARGGIDGFLRAAERADLDHVVLLSSPASYQPIEHENPIGRVHRAAERALEDSGLSHTVLYPSWLASNARRDWSASIRGRGRVALPFPDAYVTPVHLDDVAEVAVSLLTGPRFRGRVQSASGARSVRLRDLVAEIAAETGREIAVDTVSRGEAMAARPAWMPAEVLDTLLRVEEDSVGLPSPTDNSVERVTGHPARPFRDQVRADRASFLP